MRATLTSYLLAIMVHNHDIKKFYITYSVHFTVLN